MIMFFFLCSLFFLFSFFFFFFNDTATTEIYTLSLHDALPISSAPLLARVSGIGAGLAQNIVLHRDAHGPFRSRKALKHVQRLGPKAFEQCAGFLRIANGDDPLDASGVHPEAYPVVRRIIQAAKSDIRTLIGNTGTLRQLDPQAFVDETFGLPTVTDILRELEKPGRDPRPAFKA